MRFVIGNFLRGWFEGKFETIDEAVKGLGERFTISYPTCDGSNKLDLKGGRSTILYVYEENEYDLRQFLKCRLVDTPDFKGTQEERDALIESCPNYKGFVLSP